MKKLLKIIPIVFVFCFIAILFAACNENEEHKKITADYAKLYNTDESKVSFSCCAEFDNTHVLIYESKIYSQAFSTETVDGVTFIHSRVLTFDVYREGEFKTLQEAFDSGWLTHENLLTLQSSHRAKNEKDYKNYEEEIKSPFSIDKEKRKEIKVAFIAAHANDENPVTEDEISLRCYGVFDNVYVLFVDVVGWGYTGAVETDIIADIQFIYSCSQKMTVYSGGAFYSLPDAYENGILSRDDLLNVQENYIKDYEYLYQT